MSVLVNGWSIPTDGCCGCYFRTGKYCGILSRNERVLEYAERFTRPDNCPLTELIRCKDCVYYDPPHIENDGQRYEYKDMPPEAFDPITKKYVSCAYGINMGGRCCRDYECGYSEDKRVYVSETNYCGRAERKEE